MRTAGPSATPTGYLVEVPVASVSIASAGPYSTWPLWAGGSVARALDIAARDGRGTRLSDVPVHLGFSKPGIFTTWGRRGVRMLPRRDRANALVSATACGHTTSMQVLTSGYSPIFVGEDHSLALKADGTVVAWGNNNFDQTSAPARLADVVQIAAGTYHSLALKADGTVVAWGDNGLGQTDVPSALVAAVP